MSRRTLIPPSPESNTPIERVSITYLPLLSKSQKDYTPCDDKKQLIRAVHLPQAGWVRDKIFINKWTADKE